MKKTLLAIAFAVAAVAAMAQRPTLSSRTTDRTFLPGERAALNLVQQAQPKANYNFYIDNWHADDDYEIMNYFYTNNRCTSIETYDGWEGLNGSIHTFDSLVYDQNGDLVRIDCYQFMYQQQQWKYVNYVEYTYDNQHRMLTRTNYNNFGGTFELGGVYHFEYDDQGRLATRWLHFFNMRYDEMLYTYDAQGRLTQTLYRAAMNYPDQTLVDYERIEYTYQGSNAGPSTVSYTAQDANTGMMTTYKRDLYTYDAQGNCTLFESKSGAGLDLEKKEFEYETRLLSETCIPHTFEHETPRTYTNLNTYHTMHWSAANDNDVLTYVCDYLYNYTDSPSTSEGHDPAGIGTVEGLRLSLYPNPATTSLTVECQPGDNMLYLYSLDGRLALMQRLAGNGSDVTVDLSGLARGTYVARVNGPQTRTAKVIVK